MASYIITTTTVAAPHNHHHYTTIRLYIQPTFSVHTDSLPGEVCDEWDLAPPHLIGVGAPVLRQVPAVHAIDKQINACQGSGATNACKALRLTNNWCVLNLYCQTTCLVDLPFVAPQPSLQGALVPQILVIS